jgi:hypothetical protein
MAEEGVIGEENILAMMIGYGMILRTFIGTADNCRLQKGF